MISERKIFLTGGTGFFGKALLRFWEKRSTLHAQDLSVTVLSRNPDKFLQYNPEFSHLDWVTFIRGDIEDANTLPVGERYSHVLHAATDSTLGPQISPLHRYEQIVTGTRNILDFAVQCGASRFLLTSSGGVYGPQPASLGKIPEDWNGIPDPLNPGNVYSVAKRMAEHLCALYKDEFGLNFVIARCFAFIGPDLPLNAHFAIGNFIQDALHASEITVNGDGSPIRSYLAQQDLALWLDTLLNSGSAGRAYNVGSDMGIRIRELAFLVRDLLAPNKEVRILSAADVNNSVRNVYLPDIERAKFELGLDVYTPLDQAILQTASYARDTT